MYAIVPMIWPVLVSRTSLAPLRRARPKSTMIGSSRCPVAFIMMFAGFRSR